MKKYFVALECGEVRSLLERSGGSRSGITGLWWPVVDIRVRKGLYTLMLAVTLPVLWSLRTMTPIIAILDVY